MINMLVTLQTTRDEMYSNTMQLLHQQSITLKELNQTFLQTRETSKPHLRSTGAGSTEEEFSNPDLCTEDKSYTKNKHPQKEHDDSKIRCTGRGYSSRSHLFDQDECQLQYGLGNSPRLPEQKDPDDNKNSRLHFDRGYSLRSNTNTEPHTNPGCVSRTYPYGEKQTGSLHFDRGYSPRLYANTNPPARHILQTDPTTDKQSESLHFNREYSPRLNANTQPFSSTPREAGRPPLFETWLSIIHRWESRSNPLDSSTMQNAGPNIPHRSAAIPSSIPETVKTKTQKVMFLIRS